MAQIHRAASTAVFVASALFASAQHRHQPHRRHVCAWREGPPFKAAATLSAETSTPYAGGAALLMGGVGLVARLRKR